MAPTPGPDDGWRRERGNRPLTHDTRRARPGVSKCARPGRGGGTRRRSCRPARARCRMPRKRTGRFEVILDGASRRLMLPPRRSGRPSYRGRGRFAWEGKKSAGAPAIKRLATAKRSERGDQLFALHLLAATVLLRHFLQDFCGAPSLSPIRDKPSRVRAWWSRHRRHRYHRPPRSRSVRLARPLRVRMLSADSQVRRGGRRRPARRREVEPTVEVERKASSFWACATADAVFAGGARSKSRGRTSLETGKSGWGAFCRPSRDRSSTMSHIACRSGGRRRCGIEGEVEVRLGCGSGRLEGGLPRRHRAQPRRRAIGRVDSALPWPPPSATRGWSRRRRRAVSFATSRMRSRSFAMVDLEELDGDLGAILVSNHRLLQDFLGLGVASVRDVDLGLGHRVDFVGVDRARTRLVEIGEEGTVARVDEPAAGLAGHGAGLEVGRKGARHRTHRARFGLPTAIAHETESASRAGPLPRLRRRIAVARSGPGGVGRGGRGLLGRGLRWCGIWSLGGLGRSAGFAVSTGWPHRDLVSAGAA